MSLFKIDFCYFSFNFGLDLRKKNLHFQHQKWNLPEWPGTVMCRKDNLFTLSNCAQHARQT